MENHLSYLFYFLFTLFNKCVILFLITDLDTETGDLLMTIFWSLVLNNV